MLKLNEIKELIELVDQSSLQEIEIQNEAFKLFIRKPNKTESVIVASSPAVHTLAPAALPQQAAAVPAADASGQAAADKAVREDDPAYYKIVSPMVGTFYQAPSPDAPPYVNVGSKVHEKTVVCIVEAMKLMNEIEAEVKGEIVEVLVENGQLVEFGQPMFLVRREDNLK